MAAAEVLRVLSPQDLSSNGVEQAFRPLISAMILSDDGVEQAFRPAARLVRATASAAEVILWDSAVQRPQPPSPDLNEAC